MVKKRILALLLCLAMLCTMAPVGVLAEEPSGGDDVAIELTAKNAHGETTFYATATDVNAAAVIDNAYDGPLTGNVTVKFFRDVTLEGSTLWAHGADTFDIRLNGHNVTLSGITSVYDGQNQSACDITVNGPGSLTCASIYANGHERSCLCVNEANVSCTWVFSYPANQIGLYNGAQLTVAGSAEMGTVGSGSMEIQGSSMLTFQPGVSLRAGQNGSSAGMITAFSDYLPDGVQANENEAKGTVVFKDANGNVIENEAVVLKHPDVVCIRSATAQTNYADMGEALRAAAGIQGDVTIELLRDVGENDGMEAGLDRDETAGDVTFELNGHSFSTNCSIYMNGNLTVRSSAAGAAQGSLICDMIGDSKNSSHTLTVDGAAVTCQDIWWAVKSIAVKSGSTLTITGSALMTAGTGDGLQIAENAQMILKKDVQIGAKTAEVLSAVKEELARYLPDTVAIAEENGTNTLSGEPYIIFQNSAGDDIVLQQRVHEVGTGDALQAAVSDMSSGETVKLTNNITVTESIEAIDKHIIIDLNGHNLTMNWFGGSGSRTIKDTGTTKGTMTCTLNDSNVKGSDRLTVDGAVLNCSTGTQWTAKYIDVKNGGTLRFAGEVFLGGDEDGFNLAISGDTASVVIDNCQIGGYNLARIAAQMRPYLPGGWDAVNRDSSVYMIDASGEDVQSATLKNYPTYTLTIRYADGSYRCNQEPHKEGEVIDSILPSKNVTGDPHNTKYVWRTDPSDAPALVYDSSYDPYVYQFTMPAYNVQMEQVYVHNMTAHEATAATCETAGNSAYWSCSECGKYFSDAEGTTEIEENEWVLDATGHKWGEPRWEWSSDHEEATANFICTKDSSHTTSKKATGSDITEVSNTPATCETDGSVVRKATVVLDDVTYTDTNTETLSAKGHAWGTPTYEWAADNKTVTATRVCGNDSSHVETETVATDNTITKQPTCTEAGVQTFTTKAFSNEAFEQQSKTVNPPATGHEWGTPTYEWSEDNKTVTATRVCGNDETHVEEETVNTTSEVTTPATCTTKGTTTYTATFTKSAFETQTKAVEDINATGHAWGTPTYEWSEDNKTVTATRDCGNDPEHTHSETETVNTTGEVTTSATCTTKGTTKYTATFTKSAFETQTKAVEDIDATGHEWGTPTYVWSEDNKTVTATRVCGNDETHVEEETVNTTSEVTTSATCEAKGKTTYTAAFTNTAFASQTKTLEDIDAKGHEWGTPTYEWSEDNETVTATRVCGNDSSHVETETVATDNTITKQPTCTEAGVQTFTTKAFSNEAFEQQSKTVNPPATGHEWGTPTYVWSEDNKTVTATRVCGNDSSHVETETVATDNTITKQPTCTEAGVQTFTTKAFSNEAFEQQSKTVNPPATGHEWGTPTYVWSEDNKTVTATRVCGNDETHVEEETVNTTSEVTKTPTCTEAGVRTYTGATFQNSAFTTQTKDVEEPANGHSMTAHPAAAATCTTPGNKAYWTCSACEKLFLDEAGEQETTLQDVTIPAAGHKLTKVEAKAATCTEPGTKAHWHCSVCEKNFSDEAGTQVLADVTDPAIDHKWGETQYTWSADNKSVTAKRICQNDSSHVETETSSEVRSIVAQAATCEAKGKTTYTAIFTDAVFATQQTKTEEDIEPLQHKWGDVTYTWSDDNKSVTAKRVCENDSNHVQTETVETTEQITKAATCTEIGKCTYTTKPFTNSAFETQQKTVDIPAKDHDWSAPEYVWAEDYSTVTAKRTCKNDSSHVETETVAPQSVETTYPTCAAEGKTVYTATFENEVFTTQTETVPIPIDANAHDWVSTDWEFSEDYTSATVHFTCRHNSAHTTSTTVSGDSITVQRTEPTCTEDGSIKYRAEISFEGGTHMTSGTATIPTNGHTSSDEWHSDDSAHWHECPVCHQVLDGGSQSHVWDDGIPGGNGETVYTCTVCGYKKEETPSVVQIIEKGLHKLVAGIRYRFGSGTHTVSGDTTVYAGDQEFYVRTEGEYTID